MARLFADYSASLDVDLSYQGFADEVAALPGRYAPPGGALLLARARNGVPLGCVGVRLLEIGGACEMKRLYVSPEGRGGGVGKALMDAAIAAARMAGYRAMMLDTLPTMLAAQAMYRAAGSEPAEPYYDTPVQGTVFLRKALA